MNIGRPAPEPINTGLEAFFIQQFVDGHRLADDDVCLDLYAQLSHIIDLG